MNKRAISFLALLFVLVGALGSLRASPKVPMPEIQGIREWINTDKPLTREDLRGQVVLIDFWTYSCVNCVRTLPALRAWNDRYRDLGLTIIGVHSPEFSFEKDPANVRAAVQKFGLSYPIALDNDHRTWDAFSNRYWPAEYLVDRDGVVRYQHFGEGNYEQTEKQIRTLLAENRPKNDLPPPTHALGAPPQAMTPEIYLGSARLSNLGNAPPTIPPGASISFELPEERTLNRFYLKGDWVFDQEYATLTSQEGAVVVRFRANQANMVLGTDNGQNVDVEVFVDGRPANAGNGGADVALENGSGSAVVHVRAPRLYALAHFSASDPSEHTLELRIKGQGLRAYTFTFG